MQVASTCNPWLLASQPFPELEMERESEEAGEHGEGDAQVGEAACRSASLLLPS